MFYGVLIFVIAVIVAVTYSCIYDIIKSKKIMKDFDDARNNKTYAHANTIMERNEAEFLCTYMVYYYNFICKIDFKKIKI